MSSNLCRDIPVFPKLAAAVYFEAGVLDHKLALVPNSNRVERINTPKNLMISPTVVLFFLLLRRLRFVSLTISLSWSGGNMRRK
jgi:hypothetical protein